jgi:hypothetical protein
MTQAKLSRSRRVRGGVTRLGLVGLCLTATFAIGAIEAESASATPEYGQCLLQKKAEYTDVSCKTKSVIAHRGHYEWHPGAPPSCVAQKKGEYIDSSCTTTSAKPHRGHYEEAPGPEFHGEDAASVTLRAVVPYDTEITCTGPNYTEGYISSPSTIYDYNITLKGCTGSEVYNPGPFTCTSEGYPSGEIVASGLTGTLEVNKGLLVTKLEQSGGHLFESVCLNAEAIEGFERDRFAGYTTNYNYGFLGNTMGHQETNYFDDAYFGSGLTSGQKEGSGPWNEGYTPAYFAGQQYSYFDSPVEIRW